MIPASAQQLDNRAPAASLQPPRRDLNLDVLRALRMHRKLAIGVACCVAFAMLAFGFSRRPYYETKALLYVQPQKTKPASDVTDSFDSTRYESFMQQQLQTITRADVLEKALASPSARSWRVRGIPTQIEVEILQHSLSISRVEQSYELSVSLAGGNPTAVADMVNAVCDAYIRAERADELAQTDQQLAILTDARRKLTEQLDADRAEQMRLSTQLGVADTSSDDSNPYDTQLAELRSQLAKATAEHQVALAAAAALSPGHAGAAIDISAAADTLVATDAQLSAFRQAAGQRSSILTSQMSGLTPANPLYIQDQRELDQLNASVLQMEQSTRNRAIRRIEADRALEVRRAGNLEDRLRAQLALRTAEATGITPQLQHAAEVAADVTRLAARYASVDNAISVIQLEKDTTGLIHVIVPARAPLAPKTSMKRTIIFGAIPIGVGLGILAAILLLKFTPKIYVAKDLSDVLGFYPIATLPASADKVVVDEFMLRLLAGIDQIHRAEGAKTFLFTGSSANTSVSQLTETLARKMRRLGYGIAVLKAEDLIGENTLSSGVTAVASAAPTRTGNFAISRIETITRSADFIFIESHPILASSVAEYCARLAEVVVLINESGVTTRAEVKAAVGLIRRLRAPALATVLCNVQLLNADAEFRNAVAQVEARPHTSPAEA
jgi:uncharacterized protein involved in exopolysaccharide biosynthesis